VVAVFPTALFGHRLATSIRGGASVSKAYVDSSTRAYIPTYIPYDRYTHWIEFGAVKFVFELYVVCPSGARILRIKSYNAIQHTASLRRHSLCHSETSYCAHQRGSGARVVIPEIYTTSS
jgi:hypothetical protein